MRDSAIQVLVSVEQSSMVSCWNVYLCVERRGDRVLLSNRCYEAIGELVDYAVETEDGDEEYRIPDEIDGKTVAGTEDDYIVGGELMLDPGDSDPEIDLAGSGPGSVSAWLEERGFQWTPALREAWASAGLDRRFVPGAGSDTASQRKEEITAADLSAVTRLQVRPYGEDESGKGGRGGYTAEVVRRDGAFWYRALGAEVSISEQEAVAVVRNPCLYYFSTALRLQKRIEEAGGTLGGS